MNTFAYAVRSHWGIENSVHWVLDLAFREDESRVRLGHADENLAVLRHISLNLLRQEHSSRVGVHTKRRTGWMGHHLSPARFGRRELDAIALVLSPSPSHLPHKERRFIPRHA